MPAPDPWTIAAAAALLMLAATLRLSVPATGPTRLARVLTVVANPGWLLPLIVLMGGAIGLMIQGDLSPWPPDSAHRIAERYGWWAGAAAGAVTATVDLWLVWTASMVALRYTPLEQRPTIRGLPLLNLAMGGAVLVGIYLLQR